jgi:hypothetical protein
MMFKVLVEFRNQQSGEFMKVEVALKFVEPKSLAVIKFDTPVRIVARWPIMVSNPLKKSVKFTCTSDVPDIFFLPHGAEFDIPPNSNMNIECCYRPVH